MWFLAVRHLLSKKRQTILILLGISFGVTVYILIAGLHMGMEEYIMNQLLNNTPHIKISSYEEFVDQEQMTEQLFPDGNLVQWFTPPSGRRDEPHIQYPQGWFEFLRQQSDVVGYSPVLNVSCLVVKSGVKTTSLLTGIDPNRHRSVSAIEEYMKTGSLTDLTGGGQRVIVGSGLLNNLAARVGDSINISVGVDGSRPYKIAGVVELGIKDIDDKLIMASLGDVQQLNHTPGRISEIWVNLVKPEAARELAPSWNIINRDKVESWDQTNANFLQIFVIQRIFRLIVTVAILIVAGFGIYNVLSIMISQKKKEIAILRSVGYPPRKMMELFLIQGAMLGLGGALVGLLLGAGLNFLISGIDLGFQTGMGSNLLVSWDPSIYVTGFFAAMLASFIASVLPAREASRMTPIDIIRSEV
jgi:lipoprotein-releasing system permease protein